MKSRKSGFTLTESLVSASVLGTVVLISFQILFQATESVSAGRLQVQYNADARYSNQKIAQIIYRCNRLSPPIVDQGRKVRLFSKKMEGDTLEIEGLLEYIDRDGIPSTQDDNFIRYDPDVTNEAIPGGERILARNVSVMPGREIFAITRNAGGLYALKAQYYVGDNKASDMARYSERGFGFQGVKVEFTASPRSLAESVNWDQALGRQAAR